MWYNFKWSLFKPKIHPIEITELDILQNKLRLYHEYTTIIHDNISEKSYKLKTSVKVKKINSTRSII